MVSALFDTNILIDYLNGIQPAKTELDRYSDKAISLITWMEVMVGATPETEGIVRGFLKAMSQLRVAQVARGLRAGSERAGWFVDNAPACVASPNS